VSSCRDSDGTTIAGGGSGHLDTSSLGPKHYTVVMTLKNGATKTASITYAVVPLRVAIASGRAIAADRRTAVSLVCLGGGQGGTCRGTLSLTRHAVTLARTSYSLKAGTMRSIVLPLTHEGSIALKRARGHHLTALAIATLRFAAPAERTIAFRHRRA
jgi:hypothetical protein